MNNRIQNLFLNKSKKLATFVTGGDPNFEISLEIIKELVKSGADIVEIGMPFSDPMADGPIIQQSSLRSIKQKIDLDKIFLICKNFRDTNKSTPIILMGYYNPIHFYGDEKFINKCAEYGVDGLIIVDLQPEYDENLVRLAKKKNIEFIRLVTPTTDDTRLKTILSNASGFLYYVSVTGITGQKSANIDILKNSINNLKTKTQLPILVGFGIKTPDQAKEIATFSDGIVVGSSIIKIIQSHVVDNIFEDNSNALNKISKFISTLSKVIK